MKTLEEIINSGNYRHAVVVLKNKQEIEGIFVEVRVDRDSLDTNQKAYDIRHSDNNDSKPATIENKVGVNWFGTLITESTLLFPQKDEYLKIVDFCFTD